MASSPRSAASLAARFAFKPAEAVNASTSPSRKAAIMAAAAAAASTSTSTSAKRRLSNANEGHNDTTEEIKAGIDAPSSARRTSPRKQALKKTLDDESSSSISSRPASLLSTRTIASTSTSAATPVDTPKKIELADEVEWEIPDDELLAATEEWLSSSSSPAKKKVKLAQNGVSHTSGAGGAKANSQTRALPTTQTAKKPATTAAPTGSKGTVSSARAGKEATKQPNGLQENAPSIESASKAVRQTESMPNEVAQLFFDSLSDSPKAGKGGMLSHRNLLELECLTMHPSWLAVLKAEMKKTYFLDLKRFLWTEGVKNTPEISKNIFPPAREIYSWSRFTPLDKVRVVILGQDPYHNDGQAHGLAFSVRSNVAVPPSLKNIYKEIKNDYPEFQIPKHGYLGSWARQGVLMLNTSLSVRAHQANSHSKKGWEEFTDAILRQITSRPASAGADNRGVVFFAWGSPAQKRAAFIDRSKHLVLSSVHPSPLSANRGFFGNAHFKKANEWLRKTYSEEGVIDWCHLDPDESK